MSFSDYILFSESKPGHQIDISSENILNICFNNVVYDHSHDYESIQLEEIETLRQFAASFQYNPNLMVESLDKGIFTLIEKDLQELLTFLNRDDFSSVTICFTEASDENFGVTLNDFESDILLTFKYCLDATFGKGDVFPGSLDIFLMLLPESLVTDLKNNYRTIDDQPIEHNKYFSIQTAKAVFASHYDEILELNAKAMKLEVSPYFEELVGYFNSGLSNKEIFDLYEAKYLEMDQEECSNEQKLAPKPM